MANTYTKIHIQAVFAVQNRQSLIEKEWKIELLKYISGIIQFYDYKMLSINCMPDHLYLFFGMRPTQSISELMKMVKGDSSRFINKNRLSKCFSWQQGYGAFSYSKSQVPNVIKYIQQQEKHHPKQSFINEYCGMLDDFGVDYDERYLFKPL